VTRHQLCAMGLKKKGGGNLSKQCLNNGGLENSVITNTFSRLYFKTLYRIGVVVWL